MVGGRKSTVKQQYTDRALGKSVWNLSLPRFQTAFFYDYQDRPGAEHLSQLVRLTSTVIAGA
jgi:hypothetical protein